MDSYLAEVIPYRYRGFELDSHPNYNQARPTLSRWMLKDPIRNPIPLVIAGPTGTGKTGLACALLKWGYANGARIGFLNVPRFIDDQRPVPDGGDRTAAALAVETARRNDLLVMDDIGAERASEFVRERLYLAINDRYERSFSTIYTTNMKTIQELNEALGERLTSRMLDGGMVLTLTGDSLRSPALAR